MDDLKKKLINGKIAKKKKCVRKIIRYFAILRVGNCCLRCTSYQDQLFEWCTKTLGFRWQLHVVQTGR